MEKKLFLATVLSIFVLMAYSVIMPKPKVIDRQNVTEIPKNDPQNTAVTPPSPQSVVSVEQELPKVLDENNLYRLSTDKLTFVFSKKGAYLSQIIDKYNDIPFSFVNVGVTPQWSSFEFSASEILRGVVFEYKSPDAGLTIKKTYSIRSDYSLDLTISINDVNSLSTTGYDISAGSFFVDPKSSSSASDKINERYQEACLHLNGVVVRKNIFGLKKELVFDGKVLWLGIRDRYFCSVFSPQITINKGFINYSASGTTTYLHADHEKQSSPAQVEDHYLIYMGPQDERLLKNFRESSEHMVNFGTFDPISKILLFLLNVSHKVTNNWGLSIILVTLIVFFLTFPLSLKSMTSMKKIQALQPVVEQLKVKYKDNPQKMNMEVMELYKREKANPLGGCLPMLLQIPVFFALYQVLMRLSHLRGANFLWIKDLSEPDRIIVLQNNLPFMGNEINLLPILMAIGMFFQQKLSMSSAQNTSPQMAEQQKIMSIVMPIMFGVLFYKISSGLVLYWFVNSLLMMGFQWKISKAKI